MSKAMVAYFSASGVTAKAAKRVAQITGGELYEIRPETPYTRGDLNWLNPFSRSSKEMKDRGARPALADCDAPVADCDVIYLGFPIWWYTAPMVIHTFLESYDFTGKQIVLFMTSGSSGFGETAARLKESVSASCTITEGLRITRKTTEEEIRTMLTKGEGEK